MRGSRGKRRVRGGVREMKGGKGGDAMGAQPRKEEWESRKGSWGGRGKRAWIRGERQQEEKLRNERGESQKEYRKRHDIKKSRQRSKS